MSCSVFCVTALCGWCSDGSDRGATSLRRSSRPSSPRCPQLFVACSSRAWQDKLPLRLVFSPSSASHRGSLFGEEEGDLMKRIFLTGASSGIGLAVARALSANGDEVWGTARKAERIPTLPGLD